MHLPTIILGIVLSTLLGGLYHLIRGGSIGKIWLNLILAWAGFWLGDTLAFFTGWSFITIGVLNAGTGLLVGLSFLVIGDIISQMVNQDKQS